MKRTWFAGAFLVFGFGLSVSLGWAQFPQNPNFTTRALTPFPIEGLTMDATGNFYTTGRRPAGSLKCPVWRIRPDGTRRTVGFIPAGCGASGITFDSIGRLYIADSASGGIVWRLNPHPVGCSSDDSTTPACNAVPDGIAFATNTPGTNGLAFDTGGNLWTGDGTTGQGRVWRITAPGANCSPAALSNCEEVLRVQPMRNGSDLGGELAAPGVGRQNNTVPPGNAQNLVANGLAFTPAGDLFIADTARGALWKIEFNSDGTLKDGQIGCDTTFTANTLCLDTIFVAHPLLEGTDGIALDQAGNIWNSANERNAIVVVALDKEVIEIFRNEPDGTTRLRNTGPLEFPASPFLSGNTFCTSSSDGNRRDNSPNSAGEIPALGTGKISCMVEPLESPGLPLPVQ